jgi:hypothetical protein
MDPQLLAILAKFALSDDATANLATLATLSSTDLAVLESDVLTGFDGIRALGTRDCIVQLREFADAAKVISAERKERPARDAAAADQLAASLDRPATPAPAQASLAAIAASVPTASQPAPRVEHMRHRFELIGTREQGDLTAVGLAMAEAHASFEGTGHDGDTRKIKIGRLKHEYPDERDVSGGDPLVNDAKLGAVLDDAFMPDRWQDQALVASGGFCAPPAVSYDLAAVSGAQRPVWDDYLPKFRADRGALTFMTPFGISKIQTSTGQTAGSGVSLWPNTTDITPGGATKPHQTMDCPAQQTVALTAVLEYLQIGNFAARAVPELVGKFMHELVSAHARVGETANLDDIDAACTAATVAKLLGALPDLVMSVRQAASRYRNNQRMPRDAQLRVMFPAWIIDFLAADAAQRHAGDGLEIFTVTEVQVRSIFAAANCSVTFYEDTATGAGQQLGGQGSTDIRNWPLTCRWYIFHEGAMLGLDGGTLDLGIVRDSTLNGTNDFRMFSESFEKVAMRGIEAVKYTQTICPTGEGAVDHAALTCSAS